MEENILMAANPCRNPRPVFNAEFIERRLAIHNAWREHQEHEGAAEIVREVEIAIVRRLSAAADEAEALAVSHVQGSIVSDLEKRQ